MKRLLEQIGLTFLSVLAVVFYFGKTSAIIIAVLSACIALVFLIVKKYRKTIFMPAMAITALVACVINISYTTFVYEKTVNTYDGYKGFVTAELTEEPYKVYDTYCYEFNAVSVDSTECDFDFIAYHNELLSLDPGDIISIDVSFYKIESNSKIANGFFVAGDFGYTTPHYVVEKSDSDSLYYKMIRLRRSVREKLDNVLSPVDSQLCNALLLGDKYGLPLSVREDFIRSGSMHLIVVSGLHFTILASAFFLFARKLRKLRALSIVPVFIFTFLYMMLTGFTGSVLRSGVMMIVYGVGVLISRDVYSPNSLGIAAFVVVLFFGPYSAGDVGVILSFASTYSILKLSPKIYEKCEKFLLYKPKTKHEGIRKYISKYLYKTNKFCLLLLCMNISAYAVSVPLSIFFFDAFSTVSVVTSFILALPIQWMLLSAVILSIVLFLPILSFLQPLVIWVIEALSAFIMAVVSLVSSFEFSYVYIENDYVYICVIMALVLIALAYYFRIKNRLTIVVTSTLLIFTIGFVSAYALSTSYSRLTVYDVSNGTAIYYNSPSVNAVIDLQCTTVKCNKVVSEIEKSTTQVDYYSCVSNTTTGRKNLSTFSQAFAINNVLLYDSKSDSALSHSIRNVDTPTDIYTVRLSDTESIYYYLISGEYVTYFVSKEYTTLILPGYFDAADLPEYLCKADTIVVSSSILNYERLSCDTLIISTSEEFSDKIMGHMYKISNRVLLTKDGDIELLMEV